MSMHTQLMRGLLALPVAALLLLAGLASPACAPADTCTAQVKASAPALPRAVDFHQMIPGALHIVRKVKLAEG
jgi:hypothetical protein